MKKLSRKEREYRTRREEILKAAESVFAKNGFYNSTVAEIAKESEFAIGTIYQFFKNKEELYYIMMIEKFDLLYSTLLTGVGKNIKCLEKLLCLTYSHLIGFLFLKIFSLPPTFLSLLLLLCTYLILLCLSLHLNLARLILLPTIL